MTVPIDNKQKLLQKTNTRKPNFFIVGAPKCGTSSLGAYLHQHPDIFMSKPKEPKHFCTDLKPSEFSLEEYLALFQNREEKICGEATPWYLLSELAADKIYQFNPEAKIVIMLREPVSLLYSLHSQRLVALTEDIEDFFTALAADAERRKGKRLPQTINTPMVYPYEDVIMFTKQVKRYFDIFGRDKVKVIIFDDFSKNTPKIYREILEFLEVDPNFQPQFKVYNPNRKVKNLTLYTLIYKPLPYLFKLGRLITPPFLYSLKRRISWSIINSAIGLVSQEQSRPPLDKKLHQELKEKYALEVNNLSILLNRDLSYWNKVK